MDAAIESITSGGGAYPWVAYIYLGLFALGALIGACKGFSQGISRGVIRLVTAAASLVGSIFLTKFLFNTMMQALSAMTIEDIHAKVSGLVGGMDISVILNYDVETFLHILVIPIALVIVPMVFTTVFLIIYGISKIIHVIICGICGLSKARNNPFTRILGMVLGLVQGAAIMAVLLMPVIGLGSALDAAVNDLNEKAPEQQATVTLSEGYNTYVKDIAANPVASFVGKIGVNQLFDYIVTVDVYGKSTNMTKLLPEATMLYSKGASLGSFNWKQPTPEQEQTLRDMNQLLADSEYFSDISAGIVRGSAKAALSGNFPLPIPAPFDTLVNGMLEIFVTSDSQNLKGDIDTVLDVYFIIARSGVLNSFDQNTDALLTSLTTKDGEGKTTITRVIDAINANERTKPLVTLFTKLSISVMSDQLGISEETVAAYENVKTGLNDTLQISREGKTDEEYVDEVAASLDTTLKENNIEVEPEIVDTMAEYIADNFTAGEPLTDEQMNDIILNYYDAYLEYQESGTIPDEVPVP